MARKPGQKNFKAEDRNQLFKIMKKNTSILPDELFHEGFISHEEAFDNRSWEHMKTLLDEDDLNPVLIVPPSKNNPFKSTLLIITIMSTLSIFSLATWMLLGTHQTSANTETKYNTNTVPTNQSVVAPDKTASQDDLSSNDFGKHEKLSQYQSSVKAPGKMNGKTHPAAFSRSTPASKTMTGSGVTGNGSGTNKLQAPANTDDSIEKPHAPYLDSVRMVSNGGKTYRIFTRKLWVPEEYEYIEKPMEKTVQDFWMGIHFTAQKRTQQDTSMSAGFNIQFMSGNRLPHKTLAFYGGFDYGMQFYGKSKKSGVVLNNTTQDSGFTRLRTYSMDFLGRGHLEYAKFPIVPYVNVMAGPRIYSTGQVVASYLQLKETESQSSHNAHTSASLMYGFGIGARVKLGACISLDARYEYMSGTPVRLVDMDQSTFNGLNYDLKINKIKPQYDQFKVGIIFNFACRDYEKKLVKEGYYKDYMYDSLYVDPSDSNKIYLPCNCKPCDEEDDNENSSMNREQPRRIYEENTPIIYPGNTGNRNNRGWNGGSSGSGSSGSGSKGSFPGIKTSPPVRTSEKVGK
jgi:hypothetical protein